MLHYVLKCLSVITITCISSAVYQLSKITIQLPGQIFAVFQYAFYLKEVLKLEGTLLKEIRLNQRKKYPKGLWGNKSKKQKTKNLEYMQFLAATFFFLFEFQIKVSLITTRTNLFLVVISQSSGHFKGTLHSLTSFPYLS